MKLLPQLVIITLLGWCFVPNIYAGSIQYEKKQVSDKVIHVVTLSPVTYHAELVKANNGTGRETVLSIAKKVNADVAINGGYFEINKNPTLDGKPSGTLVINHKIYQIKNKQQALLAINKGNISILETNPKKILSQYSSIVSGIPLLIYNGKIINKLKNQSSAFYTQPHARTALGIKPNGDIVIIVAEEGENKTNGLTLPQLAALFKSYDCTAAINLDGGGSSTLYLNGKVVNQTIGDNDEANGLYVMRPVSDVVVFNK